jgi:hypothetical protein
MPEAFGKPRHFEHATEPGQSVALAARVVPPDSMPEAGVDETA